MKLEEEMLYIEEEEEEEGEEEGERVEVNLVVFKGQQGGHSHDGSECGPGQVRLTDLFL